MDIKKAWARIERIVDENNPKNLPALPSPATPEDIAALETHIGKKLPKELRDSLLIHDGEDGLELTYMLSCEDIAIEVDKQLSLLEHFKTVDASKNDERIKQVRWNTAWIPFAADGSGSLWCVDLDPSEKGSPGQVIFWEPAAPSSFESTSIAEFLEQISDESEEFEWLELDGRLICEQ